MNKPYSVLFGIITIAFLLLAGVLIFFTTDASLHYLASGIIGGLFTLWVPSQIQQKAEDLRPLLMELIQQLKKGQSQ